MSLTMSSTISPTTSSTTLRPIAIAALLICTLFSSACAVVHVDNLADDALSGRDNNTPGSIAAQNYLIDLLSGFGAPGLNTTGSGDQAYKQTFTAGTNILALIPGSDLANEYVIVGAHYDHLAGCTAHSPGATICNGATDNATGVAAVLEIAWRIKAGEVPAPRRSIVLAFWDREEDGLLGSAFYTNNPLVPLANTVAYINFDIQGSNLLPSLRGSSFAIGAETGGAAMVAALQSAIASQPLQTQLVSSIFGQNRSDYINFINQGVPTVFFSDSTGPCYHTTGDDFSVVDFGKLYQQINIASALTTELASGALTPTFNGAAPLASFEDALAIDAVLQLALTDLDRFTPGQQATVQAAAAAIAAIVADGSANFDGADINTLLVNSVTLVSLLASGECDGFLL
ncbi:MAG: M28 family metallopeptidase [Halioglobus sp.]